MSPKTTHISHDSFLPRLNAVRLLVVMAIAFGYASTMPIGPHAMETGAHLGYEPSWIGIQILFLLSGGLAYRSLSAGRKGLAYLSSRIWRVLPLLLAVTLTTVLLLYPVFGKSLATPSETTAELLKYMFYTVTCIDPGRPLPGLLDNALYTCLIQGAIWTLRWGLIIHIGVALLGRFETLLKPRIILLASLLATMAYAVVYFLTIKMSIEALYTPLIGLRLGHAFLLGMALWAYRNRLPRSAPARSLTLLAFGGFAAANYMFAPWTPFIEITLTLFWGYCAWLLATSTSPKLAFLSGWPHLALGLYLLNWPTAQILLHIYPDLGRDTLPMLSLPLSMVMTFLTYWALTGRINAWVSRRLSRKNSVLKPAVETARL